MTRKHPSSLAAPAPARAQRGLTLVELLVAMTLGLVIALGVGAFAVSMGRQFNTTASGSAADVNTQVALSLIDDAGRSAGAGLYNNGLPLCRTLNAWRNGTTISNGAVFMPARVTDGGSASASDTIVFTSGRAGGALSSLPVLAAMADAGSPIDVSSGGVINNGDFALVGAPVDMTLPGSVSVPCTLIQLTASPAAYTAAAPDCVASAPCQRLVRAGAAAGVNPTSPATAFSNPVRYGRTATAGVSAPAVVSRLGGEFRQTGFRVMCSALVTYNAFTDTPACTSAVSFSGGANALVTDIVLVHAQYGISNSEASDQVTGWVSASGAWANPSAGDASRVKAVRVVLVTRSKEADAAEVSAACTNTAGVVNTGPCGFDDAAAPVIDVSAQPVVAGKTWRHYRYRTHQAVIPLRSVIWSM